MIRKRIFRKGHCPSKLTKRPPKPSRFGQPDHCRDAPYLLMVSSDFFLVDFLAFFGAFFMVSLLASVPVAAGAAPLSGAAVWARAGEAIKARAVAAMISLRMRKPPLFLYPARAP